jgi:hypothetical protein
MHLAPRSLIATVVAVTAAHCAWAQPVPPIKPGLWQMRMEQGGDPEMASKIREMEEQMKSMPPEARKQVEAMMKQRGVSVSGPGEIKMCFSKEQLQDGWQGQRHDNCKTDTTRNGNTWKFHASCPAPNASETDGEATFTSPERYTMNSTTTTQAGGQPRTTKVSAVSTWLGADCGDIKPIMPKKKP